MGSNAGLVSILTDAFAKSTIKIKKGHPITILLDALLQSKIEMFYSVVKSMVTVLPVVIASAVKIVPV